jgi:hypothetical protein
VEYPILYDRLSSAEWNKSFIIRDYTLKTIEYHPDEQRNEEEDSLDSPLHENMPELKPQEIISETAVAADDEETINAKVQLVIDLIQEAKHTLVLTGPGVSNQPIIGDGLYIT